jgi:hypothetical protein
MGYIYERYRFKVTSVIRTDNSINYQDMANQESQKDKFYSIAG